jgi:hypothetical protein
MTLGRRLISALLIASTAASAVVGILHFMPDATTVSQLRGGSLAFVIVFARMLWRFRKSALQV